jgi:hypothetical protein
MNVTPEWVAAIAAVGTLIVIAASAFAALVQLRHIRSANQLTGLLHFSEVFESDEIQGATNFIEHRLSDKLRDPDFVKGLLEVNTDRREHPELRVCDFLEQQGSYIKYGMIDRDQYIDLVGAYVTSMWEALKEVVALRRVARDTGTMYENFEFLACLAKLQRIVPQKYPHGVEPLMPETKWRSIAKRAIANAEPDDVNEIRA